MGTYSSESTFLSVRITLTAFVLMRFVSLLLSLGQVRGKSTSKLFACASAILLIFINVVSQAVVYMTVMNVEGQEGATKQIWRQTGYSVAIELLAWDSIIMPLCLAIGGKLTNRIIIRFNALMV